MPPRSFARPALAAAAATALALVCAPGATAAVPTDPAAPHSARELIALKPSGKVTVHWRGNGHGHGMSQYGARGAAMQGLTARQIVAFYYPHTKLVKAANSRMRVRISGGLANTTVFANTPNLSLTGYGRLPSSGYRYFRLVPSGTGLALAGRLLKHKPKTPAWRTLAKHLPARADFYGSPRQVRLLMADGTSTMYHGRIGALRDGAGEDTINRVGMEHYVQGSVPREVPASWQAAAVRAQAIAARSYANAVRASARANGSGYDICDNTMCQMYGGMAHYDSSGNLLWTDDKAATTNNSGEVLEYKGGPVFAQYSASNGGATVSGGEPYLPAKSDPYDNAASGDPYLNESRSVRVSSLAAYFGLAKITSITVTKRDGHGPWHGRVLSAVIAGTKANGKKTTRTVSGDDLGAATGTWTDYVRLG